MWNLLLRDRRFVISTCLILSIVLVGVIGPWFISDPNLLNAGPRSSPPSGRLLLGTDAMGRDVFARLITGIRTSLTIGAYAALIGTSIAIIVGVVGGFKGGLTGEVFNFSTNIMLVFPMLPVLIILSAIIKVRSVWLVGTLIAIASWAGGARCIRSQVLSLKEREFVKLAKMTGESSAKIAVVEIMPNMLAYIIMVFVIVFGGAITGEAGISMIGLGPTDVVSLGNILYWSLMDEAIRTGHWWTFIPPGLIVMLITTLSLLIHARMDEVFNPRLRTW